MISLGAFSQENSPYSRYGMGDLVPSASMTSRQMGGIAAGMVDYDKRYDLKFQYPKAQTINFLNPASYSRAKLTTFDVGFEIDSRALVVPNTGEKFKSTNALITYLQLGFPLSRKRNMGMTIGLRPISRISYKIGSASYAVDPNSHQPIDSLQSLYQGDGGSYQATIGLAKGWKNFSIGVNTGYYFGNKNYSTRTMFINDTVSYLKSNYENQTSFGGIFYNLGVQYSIQLNKTTKMVLGAYGALTQDFKTKQNKTVETFDFDGTGGNYRIDSVYGEKNVRGTLTTPGNYSVGFVITRDDKWTFGADYQTTLWDDFSFNGAKDAVQNTWMVKIGGQIIPNAYNLKNYFARVSYRLGVNFGPDYVKLQEENLPQIGFSGGFGLPVRKGNYSNQYSYINIGLEYGRRGNTNNPLRENLFRITMGFTLSDLWFIKRKYE